METNSNNLSAYDKVLLARKNTRTGISFVQNIFDDFVELCGDRRFGDDKAVIAGIASLCGQPVTVIAQEKGRDTKEKLVRGFGCAHPEGYRKALRQMKLAEKFHRPVICFVDTAGAFCGIQAEQRGQAQAIAENLYEMSSLKTPIISVLIGEGGSGGALGLAAGDRVWMLENSVYSVISPEGCASILWKDAGKADYAAQCLKLTAQDLLRLNVAERIFPDTSDEELYSMLKTELFAEINKLLQMPIQKLLAQRYDKFRKIV